jgi:hypothetical protein
VIDTAGHWALGIEERSRGLAEVLSLPVGERAKKAEGIFRRLQFEAAERDVADDEPYVTRSYDREDHFEVVEFTREADRIVRGTIQIESDGTYSVIDPSGAAVVNRDGSEMRFRGVDEAASYIGHGYR